MKLAQTDGPFGALRRARKLSKGRPGCYKGRRIVVQMLWALMMLSSAGVARAEMPTSSHRDQCVKSGGGLKLWTRDSAGDWRTTLLPYGTRVEVYRSQGDWSRVRYSWRTGWMPSSSLGACGGSRGAGGGESVSCNIKGNISYRTGEKIYHVPGQQYYYQTKVSAAYGERWFCSESDAIRAGWRRSYR